MAVDFGELFGAHTVVLDETRAEVRLDATDVHLNPHGTVHGGAIATLVDIAMGAAVAAAQERPAVTIQMTVTYLEPARPGTLVASAEVRKVGRRITIVEADVIQEDIDADDGDTAGTAVAHAIATFTTI